MSRKGKTRQRFKTLISTTALMSNQTSLDSPKQQSQNNAQEYRYKYEPFLNDVLNIH